MPPVARQQQARRGSAPKTYGFFVVVFVVLVVFVESVVIGVMVVWVLMVDVESIGATVVWVLMSPPLVLVVVLVVVVLVVSAGWSLFPQAPTAHMMTSAPTILIDRLCISSSLFESVACRRVTLAHDQRATGAKRTSMGAKDAPTSASWA
jgi:hypothetical protein